MVNQLSTPRADETAPKATPQPPAVEPGLLYIDGAWREASDGGTADDYPDR